MSKSMKKSLFIAVLSCFLFIPLSCSRSRQSTEYHSTRFPETRSVNEAKLWLQWSRAERLAFVRGFVIGYKDGAVSGCRSAFDAFEHYSTSANIKSPSPDSSICFSVNSRFDQTAEYYADCVTTFYKTYAVDDDVPIRFLIEQFSDHESPAEIHNGLSPRQSL
jgi:hypothetical protein